MTLNSKYNDTDENLRNNFLPTNLLPFRGKKPLTVYNEAHQKHSERAMMTYVYYVLIKNNFKGITGKWIKLTG